LCATIPHKTGGLAGMMYINFDLPGDITPIVTPVINSCN
jgi:hypothetical protein